jgi:hypothetical protein
MGHIASHEGFKVDPNKIKSMMEWSILKTLNNLSGFLRLTRYYHKFFKNCDQLATPLTTLLKKEALFWTQEETRGFEKLDAMSMTLFLSIPNFTKTFIM